MGDATARLGEPVTDGLVLMPVGAGTKSAFSTAPLAGGVVAAGGAAVRKRKEDRGLQETHADPTVTQGTWGYLAVTVSQVALFEVDLGPRKQRTLGRQIASFRPGEISKVVMTRPPSRVGTLIELVAATGHRYRFETPTAERRAVKRVAGTMGVPVDATGLKPKRSEVIAVVTLLVIIAALLFWILTNL